MESSTSHRSEQETTTRRPQDFIQTSSLMTANEQIGMDAARVFQALAKGEVVEDMEHLLVAPKCLQSKVIEKIEDRSRNRKMERLHTSA